MVSPILPRFDTGIAFLNLVITASIAWMLHVWTVSSATQSALVEVKQRTGEIGLQINKHLDRNVETWTMVEILRIESATGEDLQGLLIGLLNEYESLAAGVVRRVYDEDLVRDTREFTMLDNHRRYQSFILDRREKKDKHAWEQMTKLAVKWCKEGLYSTKPVCSEYSKDAQGKSRPGFHLYENKCRVDGYGTEFLFGKGR